MGQINSMIQGTASIVGHGAVTVGTSEVQLTDQPCREVLIQATDSNTDTVEIGLTGVTTATGFQLAAGDSIAIRVDNVNKLFAISGTAAQEVRYLALV